MRSARRILAAVPLMLCLAAAVCAQGRPNRPQPQRNPAPRQVQPSGPVIMRMRVEETLVTAEIRNAPLQRALEELAERTGIIFEVQSQDNPPISVTLYKVDLEEGIQRIAGDRNSITYYQETTKIEEDGTPGTGNRIRLVRIFPQKDVPVQPSLLYIGTGTVSNSGQNEIETVDEALEVLATTTNVDAKQKAIDVLVTANDDLTYKVLLILLGDPAPEIRLAAVEGLAGMGARPALPLILLALKDANPGVRLSAVTAVALLGDTDNLKQLRPLERDPDASVAAAAEIAVRKLSMRRP